MGSPIEELRAVALAPDRDDTNYDRYLHDCEAVAFVSRNLLTFLTSEGAVEAIAGAIDEARASMHFEGFKYGDFHVVRDIAEEYRVKHQVEVLRVPYDESLSEERFEGVKTRFIATAILDLIASKGLGG
jgi:hypothetical protein